MKTEEYESVKKWFTEGTYTETTKKGYIERMDVFCYILKMTPDELAKLSPEQALKAQQDLAKIMKEKLHYREYSISQCMTSLHSFWRANGLLLTDSIMKYEGTPWLWRKKLVK